MTAAALALSRRFALAAWLPAYRLLSLLPVLGLLVLYGAALVIWALAGRFPSRPGFELGTLTWTGGPSVPGELQRVLIGGAALWWVTLPLYVGLAVFAIGMQTRGARTLFAIWILALVCWHLGASGLVEWMLD